MKALEYLFSDPAPVRFVLRRLVKMARLGSYRARMTIGAVERPHYGYIIFEAAKLASKLGEKRISILEYGVAGGTGLLAMERHAEEVERIFPVKIEIYGFDTGGGLPAPRDYRDLPYLWQSGFFAMDQDALRGKLKRSKLVLGDVAETAVRFFDEHGPAPVGAVAHDLDFYSSTADGLKAFDAPAHYFLPRVFCYFDDTMGDSEQLYSEFTGERLAIHDFNRRSDQRKIGIPFYLRARQGLGVWVNQIWVLHNFDHPNYGRFISNVDQQLPLSTRP